MAAQVLTLTIALATGAKAESALSPAKRRRMTGVAVVASGTVLKYAVMDSRDRESRMRSHFWIPVRTRCKDMSITINGVTCNIVDDSGLLPARWWLGRQVGVAPPFPFPVEPGMAFTITARPSADLSWEQLHSFRIAQLEGQRREVPWLMGSIFAILFAILGRSFIIQQANVSTSGPMQLVVGTWPVTRWLVHLWKGYSPAVINVQDPAMFRTIWIYFILFVTIALFGFGLRGVYLWATATLRYRQAEINPTVQVQRPKQSRLGKSSESVNSSAIGARTSVARGMTSPTGPGFVEPNQSFVSHKGPAMHLHTSTWGSLPNSPYAPISQSMLGTPNGFGMVQTATSPMGAGSSMLGSPPQGGRMLGSPISPLQTSNMFMASPLRSPVLPEDITKSFQEHSGRRRTRIENICDSSFVMRHTSPLTAAKTSFAPPSYCTPSTQSMNLSMTQLGRPTPMGSVGTTMMEDKNSALLLSRAPVDRKYAWWMERPNGALIYFREMIADRGLNADAELLLSQCALGMRQWLAVQVLSEVTKLMAQVEQDASRGLHKEGRHDAAHPAPAAPTAVGATSAFGGFASTAAARPSTFGQPAAAGGGMFGAPQQQQQLQQQQQQQAAAAEQEAEAKRRAEAHDRRVRVRDYTVMPRFAEPDKVAGLGTNRVESYIRKRIKELSEDKGMLVYRWDGGSEDMYDCDMLTAADSHYELQHTFSQHRPSQQASIVADGQRFWPADGRAKMVWPQHDLGPGGSISISPRALPTDAELLMHIFCVFLNHKLRPPPHAKKLPPKPAPGVGGIGITGAFGGGAALGAQQAAAAAGAQSLNLTPTLRDTHWFSSEHFISASPSERTRRPTRGAQPLTAADVARNLKCKPFLEERIGHDPDSPQKMCPQYVVGVSAKRTHVHLTPGHAEQSWLPERTVFVEVQPGPENVFQTIAVLAVETRLNYHGMLGNVDLSHPTLNIMSFIPNI